jgi:hypothetical protein
MNAKGALLSIREVVERFGNSKAVHSYYLEFGRRLEVLKLIEEYCKEDSTVLDLGAQPSWSLVLLRGWVTMLLLSILIPNHI